MASTSQPIRLCCALLLLFVAITTTSAHNKPATTLRTFAPGADEKGVHTDQDFFAFIEHVFTSLFSESCSVWASNFAPDGVWAHPTLPNGAVGTQQIISFCNDTQSQYPYSSYVPSADLPLLTPLGDRVCASIPYVFASTPVGTGSKAPFTNWGSVFFILTNVTGQKIQVQYGCETWDRKRWGQ